MIGGIFMQDASSTNSIRIVEEYSKLLMDIVSEFSSQERSIIESPNIGTVKDGCKKFYADECKRMLVELLNEYYSTEDTRKLLEYKQVLKSRLEGEYNYTKGIRSTEKIAKNWAVHSIIDKLECMERRLSK